MRIGKRIDVVSTTLFKLIHNPLRVGLRKPVPLTSITFRLVNEFVWNGIRTPIWDLTNVVRNNTRLLLKKI